MKDLDLTSLRYFVAVCDLASISRAAEQNHIVISAMSKRLTQLEEDLGATLLTRRRQGVVPTAVGAVLLERSRALLADASDISRELAGFGAGIRGKVHVVAAMSVIADQLPDDVAAFLARPEHRNVQVEIEEAFSRHALKKVRNGTSAVSIVWDTGELDGLETLAYRSDRLVVVVHPSHPLAQQHACDFADTLEHDRVGLQSSSTTNEALSRAAALVGKTPKLRAMVSTFEACVRIVRANLALAVMPEPIAATHAARENLRVLPLRDTWAQRQFVLCFREHSRLTKPTALLVDFLHRQGTAPPGMPIAGNGLFDMKGQP